MCTCKIIEKHGINPTWYSIECINNEGQKKYYSFAMANDNAAIQYAENVLCQNSISDTDLITDDLKEIATFLNPINDEFTLVLPPTISYSYLQANPSASASSQITITQPQIQIIHSTNCANSKITGTGLSRLDGYGGIFVKVGGVYTLPPGVYSHTIYGTIYGNNKCEIRSQVNYN